MSLACALACALGCGQNEGKTEAQRNAPTLRVEHTPGRPIARKPTRRAPPAPSAKRASATRFERVEGDGYRGWLRPVMSIEHWRPSETEIAALEAALPESFQSAMQRGELPAGLDVSAYERQYSGYHKRAAESVGAAAETSVEKLIEVTLYCEHSGHLAGKLLQVQGGGSCFLHTVYEVRTGRFRYWRANPE